MKRARLIPLRAPCWRSTATFRQARILSYEGATTQGRPHALPTTVIKQASRSDALGGCAQSRARQVARDQQRRGCGHGSDSLGLCSVGRRAGSIVPQRFHVETPTISFALDRIDSAGRSWTIATSGRDGRRRHRLCVRRRHRRGSSRARGRVAARLSAFLRAPICNAHGTAVAGAVGGTTLGVAPEVEIVDVKMGSAGGCAAPSTASSTQRSG